MIKTEKEPAAEEKLDFLVALEKGGIERHVDLLVITPNTKLKSIHYEALNNGVEL